MNTTLICFLGRAPKDTHGYRTTKYLFEDGSNTQPVAFFGWTLQQRIKPSRMVILGTAGSMWDHLFEADNDFGEQAAEERLALMEACEQKAVTQTMLDGLTEPLANHLGCEVSLQLISYARTEAEQVDFLHTMARQVPAGGEVHLDVTHGFRHLPMLGFLAALYLRISHQAEIKRIWYGAYDPDTQEAPVHDLSGLLKIADAFQVLSGFAKDGDYSALVPLFKDSGLSDDTFNALGKAAYYENILNISAATGEVRRVIQGLEQVREDHESSLLLPVMKQRFEWLEQQKQFEKQTHLARQALERKDYLRSILYAYEAVITRLCQQEGVEVEKYDARESVRKSYEQGLKDAKAYGGSDYQLLKNLRNQVAHGTRGGEGKIQKILLSEDVMEQELGRLLGLIEKGKLPAAR